MKLIFTVFIRDIKLPLHVYMSSSLILKFLTDLYIYIQCSMHFKENWIFFSWRTNVLMFSWVTLFSFAKKISSSADNISNEGVPQMTQVKKNIYITSWAEPAALVQLAKCSTVNPSHVCRNFSYISSDCDKKYKISTAIIFFVFMFTPSWIEI